MLCMGRWHPDNAQYGPRDHKQVVDPCNLGKLLSGSHSRGFDETLNPASLLIAYNLHIPLNSGDTEFHQRPFVGQEVNNLRTDNQPQSSRNI